MFRDFSFAEAQRLLRDQWVCAPESIRYLGLGVKWYSPQLPEVHLRFILPTESTESSHIRRRIYLPLNQHFSATTLCFTFLWSLRKIQIWQKQDLCSQWNSRLIDETYRLSRNRNVKWSRMVSTRGTKDTPLGTGGDHRNSKWEALDLK